MKLGSVYKITSPSGKIYIGQSINVKTLTPIIIPVKQKKIIKCCHGEQKIAYGFIWRYKV